MPQALNRRQLMRGGAALARVASAQAVQEQAAQASLAASAYDLDPGVTYLNHASIGTMPRLVREARARYAAVCESNPWLYLALPPPL